MSDRRVGLLSIGLFVVLLGIPTTARAQYPLDVLHEFSGYSSSPSTGPEGPLIQGRDGNLYGTTLKGGPLNRGTIFRMTRAGVVTLLHSFTGGQDGANPAAALLEAEDGNFYGTANGSPHANGPPYGAVLFKVSPAGVFSVLHVFRSFLHLSPLVQGADGSFYGTGATSMFGAGFAFRLTVAGEFMVLHEFGDIRGGMENGASPAGLIQGTDGNFYGTTTYGGDVTGCGTPPACSGNGTVFRMSPAGTVAIIYRFTRAHDGANPESVLIQGNDGNFYGTTSAGGAGAGTAFRITAAGQLTMLYAFPVNGSAYHYQPASLIRAADGQLYGTTAYGDSSATRAIFRIALDGTVTVLHTFADVGDGTYPTGLVLAGDGRFYGTTFYGGFDNRGTAFVMNPAGTTTTLHRFAGSREGADPEASLVQAVDGNFYGTTSFGGIYNFGTIFRVTRSGGFSTVYTFSGAFDGGHPYTALVQGRDGRLYGTTPSQGAYNEGTMFRVALDGTFTVLHAFNHVLDGGYPRGMTLGAEGNFYGITYRGGASDGGTVYRATPDGHVTVLHAFTGGADGDHPTSLLRASDGHFYGTARKVAFRVTASGTFSIVGNLGVLGEYSDDPLFLAQGADGQLYGGNLCAGGNLFRMSLSGVVTVLGATGTYCSDSTPYPNPTVSLTAGTDGTLYGTLFGIYYGGFLPGNARAVVFRIDAAGAVTVLHEFNSPSLSQPRSVMQATDGNLYGTTADGGPLASGTVFRLNHRVPLSPSSVVATPGPSGITLRWTAAAGATSYVIRRLVSGQPPTVVASGVTSTTFTVPIDASGADASYVVTAVNAAGESLTSTPMHLPWGAAVSRTPTITTVRDYDGDGKADLTVYRSSSADWFTSRSADNTLANVRWGAPALLDRPVPADYDGDGKADVAVYRETTGEWFIYRSSDGALLHVGWGAPALGDLPVPADYDGDGKADVAVFRGTTGEWFVDQSASGALLHLGWGAPALGDLPVPADYDGDGRTDIAVYRGSTGEWFVYQSSNGALMRLGWGSPDLGDVPVPADYDGDGRTDLAVYRGTTGEWFMTFASGGGVHSFWGAPSLGDVPVPADYDGDGRADVAVYRFSTGEWFIVSNGQLRQVGWGAPLLGDAVRKY